MKNLCLLTISALALWLPLSGVRADDKTLKGTAYQASVEQEQVRAQTKRLMATMARMLEEFRNNPAALEEVKLTEATIAKLQSLSDKEMAEVVSSMKDAGTASAADAPAQFIAASKTAKEIQVTLTRLADRLAVFQDEASVELKLTALLRRQLTNQRQTKYLREGIVSAEDKDKESQLAALEQKAIKDELDTLLQRLQKLATNPASTAGTTFAAIYSAGTTAQLAPFSESALSLVTARDFTNATASQAKVIEGLQSMLLVIGSSKSLEERLRLAEERARSLAAKEKQLARTSTNANLPQQQQLKRKQQEIADQRTILEREIAQLNAGTVPLLTQTADTMEKIDTTLQRERGFIDNPQNKLFLVNAQNGLSQDFLDIAEMLKKQADAVASANSSSQGGSDADRQALSDAASSILDAMSKMDLAQQMLNRGGDTSAAQDQMGKAQGDLEKAQSELGGAPESAPPGAGENLQKAEQSLGDGKNQASQGGPGKTQASASVGQAQDAARKALAELQKSLAASSNPGQMMAAGQVQNPSGTQTQGSGTGAGWGEVFNHTNEFTDFSATVKISDKDRAALSLLQREKSPPEYDTMARQYLKNLAEGVVPVQ